jgi:beta-lactamase superfamily II metal-dependent hydrolase
MTMIKHQLCLSIFILLSFPKISPAQVGDIFPSWAEGYLDIHHINTGKGDASFFIFPDGTTMLIDAGAHKREKSSRELEVLPEETRNPGEWIGRYVLHMMKDFTKKELDYMLLTHFHSDHMGGVDPTTQKAENKPYLLSGVTEVTEWVPYRILVDRSWPDYNQKSLMDSKDMDNYKLFLEWQRNSNGMKVEKFQVGRNDQFSLMKEPNKFKNFKIRNVVANGKVWSGKGNKVKNHFPKLPEGHQDFPSENMNSIGIKITYGNFDYFTGGDLLGNPSPGAPDWHDIETPVAKVVGPVEVNVTNHHGHFDAQNTFFIKTLRPKVHIIQSWVVNHPAPSTLSRLLSNRLYPGPREVFATNISEVGKIFIGPSADNIKGQGHIVIRVEPNGNSFLVYVLEDREESFRVKEINGPYECD